MQSYAVQYPVATSRSAGSFPLMHPWLAGGFVRRGDGPKVADPQRRLSSPEGGAADKTIGEPSRSWIDVTRSAGAGQAQLLYAIDVYAIDV